MNLTEKQYARMVSQAMPKSRILKNSLCAFGVGGAIRPGNGVSGFTRQQRQRRHPGAADADQMQMRRAVVSGF